MKANQRNYTIGERSIIIIGILSGQTLEQINDVLKKEQNKVGTSVRELNPRSFDLVKRAYVPSMFPTQQVNKNKKSFENVWEYIQNPRKMSDLKK
jgi:hypothetical protein